MKAIQPLPVFILFLLFLPYSISGQSLSEQISKYGRDIYVELVKSDPLFNMKTYAIVPMNVKTAEDQKLVYIIRDEITRTFLSMKLNMVSEEARWRAIEEQEFSVSSLADETKPLQIGKMLSIQTMLIVQILSGDDGIYVSTNAVDVETGRIIATHNLDFKGINSSEEIIKTLLPPTWKIGLNAFIAANLIPVVMGGPSYSVWSPTGEWRYELKVSYQMAEWLHIAASLRGGPVSQMYYTDSVTPLDVWVNSFPILDSMYLGLQFPVKLSDIFSLNPEIKTYFILFKKTDSSGGESIIALPGFIFNTELELIITRNMSITLQAEIDYLWSYMYSFPLTSFDYSFLHLNLGGGIKFGI
ncbi:MAG: hypothetical protein JW969_15165 [Spirochaetales bacterium]|nr:hypothetical protein [Spirochaetales bacterium]